MSDETKTACMGTDLHHNDSKGYGKPGHPTHESPRPNEGKRPGVYPGPRAGGQEHTGRSSAHQQNVMNGLCPKHCRQLEQTSHDQTARRDTVMNHSWSRRSVSLTAVQTTPVCECDIHTMAGHAHIDSFN